MIFAANSHGTEETSNEGNRFSTFPRYIPETSVAKRDCAPRELIASPASANGPGGHEASVWVRGVQGRPCCPPPIPPEAADSQHLDRADATAAGSPGAGAEGPGLPPLSYQGQSRGHHTDLARPRVSSARWSGPGGGWRGSNTASMLLLKRRSKSRPWASCLGAKLRPLEHGQVRVTRPST